MHNPEKWGAKPRKRKNKIQEWGSGVVREKTDLKRNRTQLSDWTELKKESVQGQRSPAGYSP